MSPLVLVLVVDDNHDDRTIVVSALRYFGYVVVDAPDAIHGLNLAKDWRPAIAVVGMANPGFGGTDLAAAIRSDPAIRNMPLIAMSAHPEYRTIAERVGFDLFMEKPFSPDELRDAVRHLLGEERAITGLEP